MNSEIIESLQDWYSSKCDGVWEHNNGFDISTIDNPGWKVILTGEEGKTSMAVNNEVDDSDWVMIKADEREFKGYGDPKKLEFILVKMREWLG